MTFFFSRQASLMLLLLLAIGGESNAEEDLAKQCFQETIKFVLGDSNLKAAYWKFYALFDRMCSSDKSSVCNIPVPSEAVLGAGDVAAKDALTATINFEELYGFDELRSYRDACDSANGNFCAGTVSVTFPWIGYRFDGIGFPLCWKETDICNEDTVLGVIRDGVFSQLAAVWTQAGSSGDDGGGGGDGDLRRLLSTGGGSGFMGDLLAIGSSLDAKDTATLASFLDDLPDLDGLDFDVPLGNLTSIPGFENFTLPDIAGLDSLADDMTLHDLSALADKLNDSELETIPELASIPTNPKEVFPFICGDDLSGCPVQVNGFDCGNGVLGPVRDAETVMEDGASTTGTNESAPKGTTSGAFGNEMNHGAALVAIVIAFGGWLVSI